MLLDSKNESVFSELDKDSIERKVDDFLISMTLEKIARL